MPAAPATAAETLAELGAYRHGFSTEVEATTLPPGLTEATIQAISSRRNEPAWLLEWRLKAFRRWQTMPHPNWAQLAIPPIDFQAISYWSAPKSLENGPKSLEDIDPEIRKTYDKLGIPLEEQKLLAGIPPTAEGHPFTVNRPPSTLNPPPSTASVAVDAVFDSVSVATTFKGALAKAGVIFCPMSEAVQEHPQLVQKYLGSVVPPGDNFYAALNSAVFTEGTFVYVPAGVACPMELSTYFRINARNTGQFERTLIVAEEGSSVSYLEGCTAPQRDENQLHAAVVELVAMDNATIKYSTVQNWYPGDAEGVGGVYNFVTKRGACRGKNSKISWTQVETGSAITWKYPSCLLLGEGSVGEFYSVALTRHHQQADTGTKMIHRGKNTRSIILSKGISADCGQNTYRGLVDIGPAASGSRNFTQCDSLLIGNRCGAHTFPTISVKNPSSTAEHEATTSKISDDQLFYCAQRGLSNEDSVAMIVNGFAKEVLQKLPLEFAVEAQKLLEISLEGSVG